MKAEGRRKRIRRGELRRRCIFSAFCLLPSAFFSGCADNSKAPTSQPETIEQRQADALQDPFGYGPKTDPDYNAKHGLDADGRPTLKSDVDKFLNP